MTSYVTPKKNTAYKFYVGLIDQSNTKLLKANPTIASGDFKVSTDGGAFANLSTLPSANPASGRGIMIDLSSGEMNGDNIVVQCVDAAGAEWCDLMVSIQTTARQIDDLAFPATTGRSMVVDANGLVDANAVKVGPSGSGTAQTTGDIFARIGAPAGASVSADVAAVKVDTAAVKVQTDKLTFTVANQVDSNVLDWKSATAPAMTGDAFARLGAPAGASVSADVAAVKVDTAAVKVQTDKLTFTVANQVDSNVLDWKSATAPAMTGDAFARLGAPAGASHAADVAALKSDLDAGVAVASVASTATNIKKNTALAQFSFIMTDSTTHAPATGLTVSGFRSIDGAAFAATATANATEIANGWYKIPLAAADLNGNVIALRFTATNADDQDVTIITQP